MKIEWIMMATFIGGLSIGVWKLYLFFPKTRLADDDTTPESVEILERILVETNFSHPALSEEALYQKMTEHSEFDLNRFWRFNPNRLRHLIEHYRFKDPNFRL